MSDSYDYKGMVPRQSDDLGPGTMTLEELHRLQGKDGERYRGMQPRDPNYLGPGTMTLEELHRLQGKDGERYRGMQPRDPNYLGPGTMSTEEFRAWQGKDGEIYRGLVPEDPDVARQRMTGTVDKDAAQIVKELQVFNMPLGENQGFVNSKIVSLLSEPGAVQKLLDYRIKKATAFLHGNSTFSKEHIYTDLTIISRLIQSGFDFTGFEIDLNVYLGAAPEMADIDGLLEYYESGLRSKRSFGKDTRIPNPLSPSEIINAEKFVVILQDMLAKQRSIEALPQQYEEMLDRLNQTSSLNTALGSVEKTNGEYRL